MVTISLCMIVRNEEAVLARCLDSVKGVVDEIIVVDTGSTDQTKKIARRYTERVYDFPWVDDFSAARNFSFSKATMDYCMWLDADDVLLEDDQKALRELKERLEPATQVVMLPYHTAFDEEGKPSFTYYRERLIRNRAGFRWEGAVHEAITPVEPIVYAQAAVTHRKPGAGDPDRNLRIYEKQLAEGREFSPREQFYYARELYTHGQYEKAACMFVEFLNSGKGWLENEIDACRQLSYCQYALGKEQEALRALLRSLEFDAPRAEVCCDIGKHFMDRAQYRQAIFWFETAAGRPRADRSGAFIQPDCYDYIPYLQLCVCYDRLGNYIMADLYNEQAWACKPQSEICAENDRYFEKVLQSRMPE